AAGSNWVDVANDLLRSCHVKQHITHLSECGADVFVRLYESILGEKVPDFIATPRSQEDDAHNVQAVIDSLALDYLQVSLSHITGENIVKGERESIRNLLEIFDGLLEYLTEEASESSSQNGGEDRFPCLKYSVLVIHYYGFSHPHLSFLPFSYLLSVCFTSAPKEQEYKENIFKESPKIPQPVKVYSRKTTPWNPRYSQWIPKRGTTKPKKAAPMKVGDDDLLVQLLEEFPHLHISQHTMNKMWRQQLAQTQQLKAASGRARLKLQNEIQQALKKHELLAAIIKKDRDHNKRLQEFKQRIYRQKWTENKVREKRQQVVRARKYYEDYRVQLRAKMMRARTREERIFKNLFEEGLEIQKQRLKDLRAYAQEMRAEQRREHQNELESMENYYRDQFSMLAEALSQERREIQTREKAQAQMLQKTKRELRSRMEKEIRQLQTAIMQNDDETFFQELEADRLRSRLQMASFQYKKSGFY
uniref:Centrosomal protein 95 n=1 Tax=Coturnix japonica TaxID=93934 RepID=A0A8C2UK44_COTJA